MKRGLVVLAAVVVAAAALFVGQRLMGSNQAPPLLDDGTSGLTVAAHAECAQPGKTVATYLATGSPTTLDPQWASTRADILSKPSDARPGLIRAQADGVINRCDQQLDQQAAAQAQAQQQAQQAQQQAQQDQTAAAAEAARQAAYLAACTKHGGYLNGASCLVDYPGWTGQFVSINSDGSFNQQRADTQKANCANATQNANASAQRGYPWSIYPQYHADSGVCALGAT